MKYRLLPQEKTEGEHSRFFGGHVMNINRELYLFFDAEGTLYVTKSGEPFQKFWLGEPSLERALSMFKLDLDVYSTLEKFYKAQVPMFVVSKHKEELLPLLLDGLGIKKFFQKVLINGDKGKRIREFAEKHDFPLDKCYMIGDNLELDIISARREGVNGIFLDSKNNHTLKGPRIQKISELLNFFEL